jgi:peptidoglycan hydrolase-like protein with peptidoglycan-binding domain
LRDLAPSAPEYARLLKEKLRLEGVIAAGGWPNVPAAAQLQPGDQGPQVIALRDHLVARGYLTASAAATYDRSLLRAVQRFQLDHGLTADGVANAATLEALRLPASARLKSVIVALERLRSDISSREPSSKRGVFVDPFLDDDLRDQGLTQTAAIVDGTLQLPIAPTIYQAPDNNTQDWMLPYTEVMILSQERETGSSKINPYASFDPIPAVVSITPAVDRWTVIDTIWASPVTQTIVNQVADSQRRGQVTAGPTGTRTELLSESQRPAQFLRPITLNFTLEGFDPGETLTEVKFDGIDVTPA